METASYAVAVRELCEFAAKEGDLDHRFTPAPTAMEGHLGHATVAARRGPTRQSEVHLSATIGHLTVRGRADGYDARLGRLEEVKTFKGDLGRIPVNHRALHWAQAKVYAALLCAQMQLPQLRVCLVYFEIGTQKETVLEQVCSASELANLLTVLCDRFWRWAQQELEHRARRDACLGALRFPLGAFRQGQRALAEHVFKACKRGGCLAAEAGTGTGKTIGTLFPALKALSAAHLDKVFFLTAKTTGHVAPLETLARIDQDATGLSLRVLELVSQDSACEHPDRACHGESCPLARGFYDRLPAARQAAVAGRQLDHARVRQIAIQHGVCPYYLGQEMVRWADVVVADYNYYFDSSAILHGMTVANGWRVALLIDEAHNLVERGRSMYTVDLARENLRIALRQAPPLIATQLRRVGRSWTAAVNGQSQPYCASASLPTKLTSRWLDACSRIGELLPDVSTSVATSVLDVYFGLLQFKRLVESFGPHSVFEVQVDGDGRKSRIGVRNVVPAPFLAARIRAAHAAVLFSATLSPRNYYADILGLPPETVWLQVEPPFSSDQLTVRIVGHVSTRFDRRACSLNPIAGLIGEQVHRHPGNYLAFFSSFEYLHSTQAIFEQKFPAVPVWSQGRDMSARERASFLGAFVPGGTGVGFAVLGGAFAEGVDLPGERLSGAFIATLGLPPPSPVNEMMRAALERQFGAGDDYAYLIPGLRKVVQAAGRVVRGPDDRGVVYLIDDRYNVRKVRRHLPSWWRLSSVEEPGPDGRHAQRS